ncbi:ATP-binding protein [Actinokineospora sp. 24-640]
MSSDDIQVQVLGPMALFVGGEQQVVTENRVLAMLAALALSETFTSDHRRFNTLLTGQPDDLHPSTLTSYLSKLRKLVGPEVLPAHQRNIVRIRLSRDNVDYWRFRGLIDRAHTADPDEQVRLLREASGLWQPGEPLSNLGQAHFEDEIFSLQGLRRSTCLRLIGVLRELGLFDEALTEARKANALWPLDVEVCRFLLRALAHTGNADAVESAAGEFVRRMTSAGLEVPDDLPQTTTECAELARSTPNVEVARRFVAPNQLPRALEVLHGREHELARLDWLLEGVPTQARAVAVVGTPGVGKTQLALTWAHRSAHRFPDGVLYGELSGFADEAPVTVDRLVTSFIRAFGTTPTDNPVGQYRSLLAHKSVLVVLDNAAGYEQVEPLLPAGARCAVVVTSRSRMPGLSSAGSAEEVTIEPLAPEAGLAMLRGLVRDDRITREWDAASRLVEACDGLPLAIAIVAARAVQRRKHRLATILEELSNTTTLLDSSVPTSRRITLRGVLTWSYTALSAGTAHVFRLVGIHPGPTIGSPALEFLADLPAPALRRCVDELLDSHLLEEVAENRFRLHDVLRRFAVDRAAVDMTDEARSLVRLRALDYLLWNGKACDLALDSGRELPPESPPAELVVAEVDEEQALIWFEEEYPAFVAALTSPAYQVHESHHWRLAMVLVMYQRLRGQWRDCEAFLVAARETAARTTEPLYRAMVHRQLGATRRKLHKLNLAASDLQEAIRLARQSRDKLAEAHGHQVLGSILESQRNWPAAIEHYGTALATYEKFDDVRGVGYTASGLISALMADGRSAEVGALAQKAMQAGEEGTDGYGRAAIHRTAAQHHLTLGNLDLAIDHVTKAIDEYRRTGAAVNEAHAQHLLATALVKFGDHVGAQQVWQRAREILTGIEHLEGDDRRLLDEVGARLD